MNEIPAWALANTVTGFATVLAGLVALALTAATRPQPARWLAAYGAIVLTGIPTVWYHGYGETFWPGFADISTNLLLGWLLQVAALGDGYSRRTRTWIAGLSGLVNLAAVL